MLHLALARSPRARGIVCDAWSRAAGEKRDKKVRERGAARRCWCPFFAPRGRVARFPSLFFFLRPRQEREKKNPYHHHFRFPPCPLPVPCPAICSFLGVEERVIIVPAPPSSVESQNSKILTFFSLKRGEEKRVFFPLSPASLPFPLFAFLSLPYSTRSFS